MVCLTLPNETLLPPNSSALLRMLILTTTGCMKKYSLGSWKLWGKKQTGTSWHLVCVNRAYLMISSKVRLNCEDCLFACGSNFKGSELKFSRCNQMRLWKKRYRFRYQLHWMNILVCSWTGPVVYVEGVNSRVEWRSADNLSDSRKKCFSLAICLCYKAKEIYLHVEPPTVRYLTVKYRTRAKRQLQGDSFLSNVVVFCRKDESWGYPSFGQEISEKKNSVLFSLRK